MILVLSGPSGVGKTTLSKKLIERHPEIVVSISHTTRNPRGQEQDGVHYYFVTDQEFDDLVKQDGFAEFADVFEHRYGTSHKTLKDLKARGQVPLLDIDYQGAEQIRSRYRDEVVPILIVPPSIEQLEHRLKERKTDSEKQIAIRLAKAKAELSHWRLFKYVVTNDSLEAATEQLVAIYQAEKAQTSRNHSLLEKLTQGGH